MFWTGCEVADLNQGQKTIKMNHRNKIQSLVSPTDDPGDAPDCMCESGPLYLEYGHICHKSANFSKYGFSAEPKLNFVTLVLLKPPKSMPASKYGQQRENGKKNHQKLKNGKKKENILEKIRNFSALDERDCQAAWLFAHWGQFGRETRAWPDGADPPHFHMHIGKIGQFLEVWVFP